MQDVDYFQNIPETIKTNEGISGDFSNLKRKKGKVSWPSEKRPPPFPFPPSPKSSTFSAQVCRRGPAFSAATLRGLRDRHAGAVPERPQPLLLPGSRADRFAAVLPDLKTNEFR